MVKLNENVCAQIERAAQLLREVATGHTGKAGRRALMREPDVEEIIDVAASLEAIVKRAKDVP